MSKEQLEKHLEQLNKKIDLLIIEGKDYKELAKQHATIIKQLNNV